MRKLLWLLLPAGVLALDLGSKAWILHLLQEGESLTVIKGFFSLSLGFNRGAIFGSLTWVPAPLRAALFAVAGLVALLYFGRLFLADETPKWDRVCLGLILGGALGNGIDRLMRGAVVDFLDFYVTNLDFIFLHIREWHYWIFNVADSFILVGAVLFGIRMILASRTEAKATGS